jgi:hypothetical protein
MAEIIMADPSIGNVIDREGKPSRELAFSFYILWIFSHAYAKRQRKVLNEIEWTGWLQFMRNCFRRGSIGEKWKQVEPDKWFDPAFQIFVNTELVAGG